jgi:two-component system OmpR family sensor kinase
MLRTLYAKLLAVLIGLSVIMGVVFLVVIRYSDVARNQEINQNLYRSLASRLIDEQILSDSDSADPSAVQTIFDRLRIVNPRIDVYLLDDGGRVLAASVRDGIKRSTVDLAPIRALADPNAKLPVLGDDPSDESRQRVFSVASVPIADSKPGYLYLVLRGFSGDTLAQRIKQSYVLRESLYLLALSLVIALVASALLIKLVTRPLRQLSSIMHKFKRSGFAEHPREALPSPRDEIGSLADTFHRMTDRILDQMAELRQTDAVRREFVANISHDLRTPLASLQGYLETLNLKRGELEPEEERIYLQTALRQTEQLTVLVARLFDLARLDSEQVVIHPEPFALGDLVQDVVQEFGLEAQAKAISISAAVRADLPLVMADIGLMERVLRNLIENALRYTGREGAVTVSANAESAGVMVEVRDSGIGIPADELPRIFNRFYRVEKSRGLSEGSAGLGLAIAKRILELHGSSIAVESEPGRTVFRFCVKYASDADGVRSPDELEAPRRTRRVPAFAYPMMDA